jgi:Zn-dependent alcohol dehydrogenase
VLVRLAACGVCHTDMYTASGVDLSDDRFALARSGRHRDLDR